MIEISLKLPVLLVFPFSTVMVPLCALCLSISPPRRLAWQRPWCTWSQPSLLHYPCKPREWVPCWASVGCCSQRSSRNLHHAQWSRSPSVHPTWLTGVEGLAGFRGNWLLSKRGQSRARQAFQSIAWRISSIISFVTCSKADKSGTVWHAIFDIAVSSLANADVMRDFDVYGQRKWISHHTSWNHGNL